MTAREKCVTPVALITGGAKGIGKAICFELSGQFDIAFVYRSTVPSKEMERFHAIRSDLCEAGEPQRVIDTVMERFGRLDVIVNNAGVVVPTPKETFDGNHARQNLDTHLILPAQLLAAALPHLGHGASIISISSVNAYLPPRDAAIYGASKAALNLWTKAMAKELGPSGIRVNGVAPGAVNTPENPRSEELTQAFVKDTALGRVGTPQDIAKVVRFLASEEASFITGETIVVSGGYRL